MPKRQNGDISIWVRFNESAIYNHGDSDQLDWNKLIGIKKRFFKPMQDSTMIAWRYNVKTGRVEITSYKHENGVRYISDDIDTVDIGEWFLVSIVNPYKKGWLIKNWFGGQKRTKQKLKIEFNSWFYIAPSVARCYVPRNRNTQQRP